MKQSKLLIPLTASLLVLATGPSTATASHEHATPQLEFGTATTRFLPRATGAHEFRFELSEPTRVHIETRNGRIGRGAIDTWGELLDVDGRVLVSDDNSGNDRHFRIVEVLQPGSYVLRVRGDNRLAGGRLSERSNRYTVVFDHE